MVDPKRLLDEFVTLASFDSESFHEEEIAGYLQNKLGSLGLEVNMDDTGNIYAFLKGNSEGELVLFSAHMDTVAPGKGKKVIIHPDGKVTSDGTTVLGADDATGIAAILEALTVIRESDLPHPDIETVFFVAEEPYCRGSSAFDHSKIKSRFAYVFDLDGAVGTIANRAPSIISFKAVIEGKSAHAGFEPENGISAVAVAALAVSRMKLGRIDAETTANIGLINGGTGRNIVPGRAVVEGEVRSLDGGKANSLIETIAAEFRTAAQEYGAQVIFEAEEMISAYCVDEASEVIRKYKKALESLEYGPARIVTTFGGSDNNSLNKHGIEGIVVSNAMHNVHTTSEFFYVDEFVKSAEIAIKLASSE